MVDGEARRVAREGGGTIMDFGKHAQGEETAKKDIMVKTGSGWDEEDIFSLVGLAGVELGEDGDEEFGNWEGEEEVSEVVFPGGLGPGASVGGGVGTDMQVVEEKEGVYYSHVVHGDGGD